MPCNTGAWTSSKPSPNRAGARCSTRSSTANAPQANSSATLPGLTQPTVSRHLRVLREVGLVEVRPDAQRRIYALRADGLVAIDDWIDRYRRYWADHLDALERHLQRKHKESQ